MRVTKGSLGFLRGVTEDNASFLQPIYLNSTLRIGTNSDSNIIIDADFISQVQCEITSREENGNFVALLTDKSFNGTYLNRKLIGFGQTVILYPGSVISFVSKHLSLMYIQAYEQGFNYKYDENFLTSLYPQDEENKNNKQISVTRKVIGSGSQARVYLSNVSFDLKNQLACKVYFKKNTDAFSANRKATEIKILKENKHANVMSMISEFEKDGYSYTFSILYPGGTLKYHISQRKQLFEDSAFFIFRQLASGLSYLHRMRIIHRDLKPENILLADLNDKPRVVINDFGLSIYSKSEKHWPSNFGTLAYHSPEIIDNKPYNETVDCWALGVILYEMLVGKHPFVNDQDTAETIMKNIVENVPDLTLLYAKGWTDAKDVVVSLLQKDPENRISASSCLFSNKWAYKNYNDLYFTAYRFRVQRPFKRERKFWFGEEDEPLEKLRSNLSQHPDDNEEVVRAIKRRRGLLVNGIFKNKALIPRHPADFSCLQTERFPRRTFLKKPISMCLSTSSSDDSIEN